MVKWYNKDMANSKNRAMYGNKMTKEITTFYKERSLGQEPAEPKPSQFIENFETNWFNNNTFISEYNEEFGTEWFDNNTFINEYGEECDIEWFIYNIYVNQDTEDFEGVDWDE